MQTKTNETPEPEQETTESALSRCLVEGDAATKSRNRRRRGEALGISVAIESAMLALILGCADFVQRLPAEKIEIRAGVRPRTGRLFSGRRRECERFRASRRHRIAEESPDTS